MEIQKAKGIVLSSKQVGEADTICKIFTKEFGKRTYTFKGIKKSRRRPLSISEPGTIANLLYYFNEEKSSYTVNEFQIKNYNFNIRNNLKKIYLLYFVLELVEKTTGYNDKNKLIFDLLSAGIDIIAKTLFPAHLSVFFSLHLLRLQGILPDFKECKSRDKTDFSNFTFNSVDFRPVRENCIDATNPAATFLNGLTREYIQKSLSTKFQMINNSKYKTPDIVALLFQISLFIENYYHVTIKSKGLLINELNRLI